jgi:hypothetical protein
MRPDQPVPPRRNEDTESLADALVGICAGFLAGRAAQADNPDTYQVIIHAGAAAISSSRQGHHHRRHQRRVRVLLPRRRAAIEQPAAPGRRPGRHYRVPRR